MSVETMDDHTSTAYGRTDCGQIIFQIPTSLAYNGLSMVVDRVK